MQADAHPATFPLREEALRSTSTGLLIQTSGQLGLQDELSFFLNASICECSTSFVFICVWLSGLTPTFNSCGKYSQTFYCQGSFLLLLCFCLPPTSVCLSAVFLSFFMSPPPISPDHSPLNFPNTHTHTHSRRPMMHTPQA